MAKKIIKKIKAKKSDKPKIKSSAKSKVKEIVAAVKEIVAPAPKVSIEPVVVSVAPVTAASPEPIKDNKYWVDFAVKNNVKADFFAVPGEKVRRTSDGKAYETPQEFWAENPKASKIEIIKG